jgi:hypothetical protein
MLILALENRYRFIPVEGSNPSPSALTEVSGI